MRQYNRREFLGVTVLGTTAFLAACEKSPTRPSGPTQEFIDNATIELQPEASTGGSGAVEGWQPLSLGGTRDAMLYVPPGLSPSTPAPLLVLLHGAGGSSADWDSEDLRLLYDGFKLIVLAPDSRFNTWDLVVEGEYHSDVDFMQSALEKVFDICNIDTTRMSIGGFSDGASEAMGLGFINAHLFSRILAFSPGLLYAPFRRGNPDVYYTHGTLDEVIPIQVARNTIVPILVRNGCEVDYNEFEGGHEIPFNLRNEAIEWAADSRAE